MCSLNPDLGAGGNGPHPVPAPSPQDPGTTPTPARHSPPSALRPPPCGPSGTSRHRPWSHARSLGLGPSRSRAAESCEKNAPALGGFAENRAALWGLLLPLSPPSPAQPSPARPCKPQACSRDRGSHGREGPGQALRDGSPLPSPPHPQARKGPREAGRTAWREGAADHGLPTLPRVAGCCPRLEASPGHWKDSQRSERTPRPPALNILFSLYLHFGGPDVITHTMAVHLAAGGGDRDEDPQSSTRDSGSRPNPTLPSVGRLGGQVPVLLPGTVWVGLPGRDESACTLSRCPLPTPTFSSEGALSPTMQGPQIRPLKLETKITHSQAGSSSHQPAASRPHQETSRLNVWVPVASALNPVTPQHPEPEAIPRGRQEPQVGIPQHPGPKGIPQADRSRRWSCNTGG